MNDNETRAAILHEMARLRNWYAPRPTPWGSLGQTEQAAMSREWVDSLLVYGAAAVADAVDVWQAEGNEWFPSLNDMARVCRAVVQRRQQALRAINATSRLSGGCDGSGWTNSEPGLRPCLRCNPWLAKIFGTPKWASFLSGTPLAHLIPELRLAGSVTQAPDGDPMPGSCRQTADYDGPALSLADGIVFARSGYLAESHLSGRLADLARFEAVFGVLV